MVLNDGKQQIYGPTVADRRAWHDRTCQAAVGQVKDLGIWHYGYGYTHPYWTPNSRTSEPPRAESELYRFPEKGKPRWRRPLFMAVAYTGKRPTS